MSAALIVLFALTYAAIAFEHPLRIDKSASALVGAGVLWTVYALATGDPHHVDEALSDTVVQTAQIVFFLIGAMTIVEVVDAHHGFDVVTSLIRTRSLPWLMTIVAVVTFLLSAVLDNLTTTIVMVAVVRRLLRETEDRWVFAGLIVIAANAGGAWSPIGDVTTTMLWIGGRISSLAIVRSLWLPSALALAVPLALLAWQARGRAVVPPDVASDAEAADALPVSPFERRLMFFLGLGILVAVPAFKTATHLPPFVGLLLGLGLLWAVGDLVHRTKPEDEREPLRLVHALARIDMPSMLFFIGILMAVATLEHAGLLGALAASLDRLVGRQDLIVLAIGLASAVVDNVPLVAASMAMYSPAAYPMDHFLWEFLAYCAGTGGSILIIGSAAGVAAMGLEGIRFGWYLRRFSGLALLGYLAGAGGYLLLRAA